MLSYNGGVLVLVVLRWMRVKQRIYYIYVRIYKYIHVRPTDAPAAAPASQGASRGATPPARAARPRPSLPRIRPHSPVICVCGCVGVLCFVSVCVCDVFFVYVNVTIASTTHTHIYTHVCIHLPWRSPAGRARSGPQRRRAPRGPRAAGSGRRCRSP